MKRGKDEKARHGKAGLDQTRQFKTRFYKHNRLYDSVRWRKVAKRFLDKHPLCVLCAKAGREIGANTVDHIEPHHNDPTLFWDEKNLQALCATCHSAAKRMQDTHGYSQACDVNGYPIDREHPFNKGRGK